MFLLEMPVQGAHNTIASSLFNLEVALSRGFAMDHTARVTELVLRWEELRDHGRSMTAEELCRECPELLQEVKHRLAALASVDRKLASGPAGRSPQRLPV